MAQYGNIRLDSLNLCPYADHPITDIRFRSRTATIRRRVTTQTDHPTNEQHWSLEDNLAQARSSRLFV